MRKHEPKKRRSLSLSEQTFPIIEQITAGMPGGFFIYHADEEERLIYANRALFQIYGCKDLEEFQALTGYTFPGWSTRKTWKPPSRASGTRSMSWVAI